MEKKGPPAIRRNGRQSTDTRKVVKLEEDTDKYYAKQQGKPLRIIVTSTP